MHSATVQLRQWLVCIGLYWSEACILESGVQGFAAVVCMHEEHNTM